MNRDVEVGYILSIYIMIFTEQFMVYTIHHMVYSRPKIDPFRKSNENVANV
jgi:hypothetical protein